MSKRDETILAVVCPTLMACQKGMRPFLLQKGMSLGPFMAWMGFWPNTYPLDLYQWKTVLCIATLELDACFLKQIPNEIENQYQEKIACRRRCEGYTHN